MSKIKGYRELEQYEIDSINKLKELEMSVNNAVASIRNRNKPETSMPTYNPFYLAEGYKNLELAFMWFVKSLTHGE